MPDDNPSANPEAATEPATNPETPATEGAEAASETPVDAVEATSTETAPEPAPEPVVEQLKRPISAELAELTRRAAIAQRIEKRAQERELEVSRREREMAEREKEFAETDELGLLQRVAKAKGIDFNTMLRRAIQRHANDGQLPPEEAAKAKEEQRERELAELKAWKQEQEQRRVADEQQRQVREWQNEVVATARSAKDALPFLSDLPDSVVAERAAQTAGAYFRETGQLPDNTDLLNYLEAQEQEAVEREADLHLSRLQRLGKIPGVTPSSDPGNPQTSAKASGASKPVKTLTNTGASQRAAQVDLHKMSERERIDYAAQLLQ